MIGSLMMCMSVVILLVGMLAGIVIGIQQNFVLAPAHAHLNLIGGVLLFLFGLYYRLVPAVGPSALAKVQGWLHMIGAIVFPVGVAVVLLKGPSFEAAPILGSLIVVAAMALFVVIVFRPPRAREDHRTVLSSGAAEAVGSRYRGGLVILGRAGVGIHPHAGQAASQG